MMNDPMADALSTGKMPPDALSPDALSPDALSPDALSPDALSAEATIALLIGSLTAPSAGSGQAVPEYTSPFIPIYEALADAQPLTLRALRTHSPLLRDGADLARDQTAAIHQVSVSCKQIPPTPLPALPLGF